MRGFIDAGSLPFSTQSIVVDLEDYEFWAVLFEVTAIEVSDAVRHLGNRPDAVERYLRNRAGSPVSVQNETSTLKQSSAVRIRKVGAFDTPSLKNLVLNSTLPLADGNICNSHEVVVAEDGGVVVGLAAIERCGDTGLVAAMCVLLDYQGRGTGSSLLQHAITRAAEAGIRWLFVNAAGTEEFFKLAGFEFDMFELLPEWLQSRFISDGPGSSRLMSLRMVERRVGELNGI